MLATTKTNSLFLTFSPRCPPYAEVAAFLLSGAQYELKLGLKADLTASEATLIVPKSMFEGTNTLTHVHGKPSIARFFARLVSGSPLYEGKSLTEQVEMDSIIESCRPLAQFNQKTLVKMVEGLKTPWLIKGAKTPTLADLMLWDAVRTATPRSAQLASWVSSVESLAPVKQAVSLVDKQLLAVPVLDEMRLLIVTRIAAITKVPAADIALDTPRDRRNGDFCLPTPRLKLPGNPVELAKTIADQFPVDEAISACSATGPFVNFTVSKQLLTKKLVPQVLVMDTEYGSNADGFGKMAVVEFSSPNIAKPFHAGHLRSTIIGNFVQNVLKMNGWKTVSINYLGDWGKQYGMLALGFHKYGNREALKQDAIKHLFEVYVKINADARENPEVNEEARSYFKKMEEGDKESLALWKEFRDLSIVKYKEIYHRLNVSFDIYSGESQYSLAQMQDVLHELKKNGLLVPDQGAEIVDLKEFGLGASVIAKSDGSMLYLSRDIAAAIERYDVFSFDRMFYIVGNQQDHHFKQLFKIIELMGKSWADKCTHVNFGLIKSKDGQMSTRKGTVVFLQQILDDTQDAMHNVMKENETKYAQLHEPEKTADLVGISSIVVQDMSARRHKDYEFDWNRMLSFEGDTGPYLQYAHARLCSIERTYGNTVDPHAVDLSLLSEPQAVAVLEVIAQYPDLVKDVAKSMEPNMVITFMFELCHRVSGAVEKLYVMGQERPIADARLAMYRAARITLSNALRLIGLRPLERM